MHPHTIITANIPRRLKGYAQNRIGDALAAFADRFDTVKASVVDRKDRSGQVTCEIKVRLVRSGMWIIQESYAANVRAAIERAADRIALTLGRQVAHAGT